MRVGEKSTSSLESNLEGLASVLEADLHKYKNKIIQLLSSCVMNMPQKLTIYSTLVGLMNVKNHSACSDFLEVLVKKFKESLRNCDWSKCKNLIKFFADLVNCNTITVSSIVNLFENFVNVTLEESVPQVRSDYFVYAVLSCLPLVGKRLHQKRDHDLNKILAKVEHYMNNRPKIHLPILQVWRSSSPYPQEEISSALLGLKWVNDQNYQTIYSISSALLGLKWVNYLDCLWTQIKRLHSDKWHESTIIRPYVAFASTLSDIDSSSRHELPNIMPPPHHSHYTYPSPRAVFRLFSYTDLPEGLVLPGAHTIERWLVEEDITQLITSFGSNRKTTAEQLLIYPVKNKVALNYIIIEVMFSQLFLLPVPPFPEIAFAATFIELCKMKSDSIPQVLALATELLFERIDTMHIICVDRFVNWFSHHLSNFQFKWSWDDWEFCLEKDKEMPQPRFITEVLSKCMRLSYYQRIEDVLPTSFHSLLPPKPEPIYLYKDEKTGSAYPGYPIAKALIEAFKKRSAPQDVIKILKEFAVELVKGGASEEQINSLIIEVFLHTLLFLGSKTFSHSFNAIAKYLSVFQWLGKTDEAQTCILESLYTLWQNHSQAISVFVDKFLKTRIVRCWVVATWIFSDSLSAHFTSSFVWEILHSTINKMLRQSKTLCNELELTTGAADLETCISARGTENMEKVQREYEESEQEQKNLFLIIFQRFITVLNEYLVKCETNGLNVETPWYHDCLGRLQQIFLLYGDTISKYLSTLESLLFTSDIDPRLLQVFQQFCALSS